MAELKGNITTTHMALLRKAAIQLKLVRNMPIKGTMRCAMVLLGLLLGLWCHTMHECVFLHAKPWTPDGQKSIFTTVIHYWRSTLRQFGRARTIDEYDVTMPVSYIRVTPQINCNDVTVSNQKRLSLATMAKSVIDNCFSGIVCSGHQIACKK